MHLPGKRIMWLVGLLVLAMCQPAVSAEKATDQAAKAGTVSKVVATVNGIPIPRSLYEEELELAKQQYARMGKQFNGEEMEQLRKKILQDLIDQELLYQESKKLGIQVKPEDVMERINNFKSQYPSEEIFNKALASMNLSVEKLKSRIERYLAIKQLIDTKLVSGIQVSESESKAFYDSHQDKFVQPEQVKASHILIQVRPDADEQTQNKAKQKIDVIRKKIIEGESFEDMAKQFSEGPSKKNGGDLGYFSRGKMVKPFEDAAFKLKLNEVSEPVKTPFGYHLIKVTDKKPQRTMPFEEAKEIIAQQMKQNKINESVIQHLDELKKQAKIETFM